MNCGEMCGEEGRSFLTAEEKVERLTKYHKWLELEKQGVEEAMARIKKSK